MEHRLGAALRAICSVITDVVSANIWNTDWGQLSVVTDVVSANIWNTDWVQLSVVTAVVSPITAIHRARSALQVAEGHQPSAGA